MYAQSTPDTPHESTPADFFSLLKPRVMTLVVFTGICGMVIAPGFEDKNLFLAAIATLCLAIGAGAAGAINMWYDRDIDAIMHRTKKRPIPDGRVTPAEGLAFAVILSLLAVMVMGLAVNWVAASILAFANFFYSVIYTMWLKRSTPQNIVIGGAAGAFPPMIGWAAVTGDITIDSVILFAIIFLWTPPHFWALSLFSNEDYKRANVPMLTVTHGEKTTKIQMLAYTLILFPLCLVPYFTGLVGIGYAIAASILNTLFIVSAAQVMREKNGHKNARRMFAYSIFYLFAIFGALVVF
jgi:protoheme IX farnesyltransferase